MVQYLFLSKLKLTTTFEKIRNFQVASEAYQVSSEEDLTCTVFS